MRLSVGLVRVTTAPGCLGVAGVASPLVQIPMRTLSPFNLTAEQAVLAANRKDPIGDPANGMDWAPCYAHAEDNYEEDGVQAVLLVTNPTPATNSEDANWVGVSWDSSHWLQVGWIKGLTPGGSTGSSVDFYVEYCIAPGSLYCANQEAGYHQFTLLGPAVVGSQHTFTVQYEMGTGTLWQASIDSNVEAYNLGFSSSCGPIQAIAEAHNNLDKWSGHVYSLQYIVVAERGAKYFNGDGNEVYGADPPMTITMISTWEWSFKMN